MHDFWLVETTAAVASTAVVIWRLQRLWSRKRQLQRVADFELVDSLIEEAMTERPSEPVQAIACSLAREMSQRGYAQHLVAMVTPAYVDEIRRTANRRAAARHHRRKKRKAERLRKGSPYRLAEPVEKTARKRNLEDLLESAGVDPEELDDKRRRG